jgi:predicted AlkP superfamily pyrophosphatase or phosphodiesterase
MKRITLLLLFGILSSIAVAQSLKTENIILVTLDGFRWQEMFNGADSGLMRQQQHLKDAHLKEKFWRPSADERRKALLPFFWNTVAVQGQLYGNRSYGSKVDVTNGKRFSYPGYNEILTGRADDKNIDSNDKKYNPNANVLEFINNQKGFEGKVAAFTSWDVFPFIINDKRNGIFVSTGVKPVVDAALNDREKMMNQLIMNLPNPLGDVRLDAFTFYYGLEYMKKNKPRVIYFSFDETDDFAHAGEYAAYLNSAHYANAFMKELWEFVQADPQYKNKTTFIFTVDHGRGVTTESWKHHGEKYPEASQIWIGILGPDTEPLGELKNTSQVYQNQIAQTIASLLGLDFEPHKTGDPIKNAVAKKF